MRHGRRRDSCPFGADVAEDGDIRRDRYEELWPVLADTLANTMIDFGESTNVTGPRVNGYASYPIRAGFLSYSVYAPYDDVVAWIEEGGAYPPLLRTIDSLLILLRNL